MRLSEQRETQLFKNETARYKQLLQSSLDIVQALGTEKNIHYIECYIISNEKTKGSSLLFFVIFFRPLRGRNQGGNFRFYCIFTRQYFAEARKYTLYRVFALRIYTISSYNLLVANQIRKIYTLYRVLHYIGAALNRDSTVTYL